MYKWQTISTGAVHAAEFLEMDTLCGRAIENVDKRTWQPVVKETKVTCLNCERQIRYLARDGFQYREWMGDPNAWHPRFGPKPSRKRECEGHPAGPYDPMGVTVYCDGTCV